MLYPLDFVLFSAMVCKRLGGTASVLVYIMRGKQPHISLAGIAENSGETQ